MFVELDGFIECDGEELFFCSESAAVGAMGHVGTVTSVLDGDGDLFVVAEGSWERHQFQCVIKCDGVEAHC